MTPAALLQSALTDPAPPPGLSPEALTLWLIKANRWEEAHDIAQEIPSVTGSWLHALLHLIAGDTANAGYWFAKANRPALSATEIDAEWERLATAVLQPEVKLLRDRLQLSVLPATPLPPRSA